MRSSLKGELNRLLLDFKDDLISIDDAVKKIMTLFYERERDLVEFLELKDDEYLDDLVDEDDEYGNF